MHPRGSPRGYWPVFEPISALSEIVNVLITKRGPCGCFSFLGYGVLLTRRWNTMREILEELVLWEHHAMRPPDPFWYFPDESDGAAAGM